MLLQLLFCLATLALQAAVFLLWSRKLVPAEVAKNDADITANGSSDDLRKGYHSRRTWVRFWQWLGCSVVAAAPALYAGWGAAALAFVGAAALLGCYFARYFTPLLNLARVKSGRTDLSEWHASSDSASWPDAAVWKQVRAQMQQLGISVSPLSQQLFADNKLKALLPRTWLIGKLVWAACLTGYVGLVIYAMI